MAEPASWNARPQAASFFTLRAVAEKLLRRFGIDIYALRTETLQNDLFGEALSMSLGGKELLQIGTVSAKIRRRLDVKQDVYYLEMNFDALVKSTRKHKIAAEELSKFPEVKRDLALLIDKQSSTPSAPSGMIVAVAFVVSPTFSSAFSTDAFTPVSIFYQPSGNVSN